MVLDGIFTVPQVTAVVGDVVIGDAAVVIGGVLGTSMAVD